MPEISINYLAVLVCGIIYMGVGALWYSPLLFGKIWTAAMGNTGQELKEVQKRVWLSYLLSFISALITAFVLAHIIDFARADTAVEGLQTGLWVWLGFVITTGLAAVIFEGRSHRLYFIYNGYMLVSFLIMGLVLAVWS